MKFICKNGFKKYHIVLLLLSFFIGGNAVAGLNDAVATDADGRVVLFIQCEGKEHGFKDFSGISDFDGTD